MNQVLLYLLLFLAGGAVGSFLNVLISRSVKGEQWTGGRSKCDHCGRTLAWWDMIPVVSYLLYRGRSRCCKKPLSMQHVVVESLLGLLFVWWLAVGTLFFRLVTHPLSTIQPLYWLILGILLLGILVTDMYYGLIPSPFVWGGVVVTILYRLVLMTAGAYQAKDLLLSLGSAAGAWAFFWFLRYVTKGKGMGDGDVMLAVLMGLVLSWPKVTVGVLGSFVVGAVFAVAIVALGKKGMKSTIPFGPFMIIGIVGALLYGDKLLQIVLGY